MTITETQRLRAIAGTEPKRRIGLMLDEDTIARARTLAPDLSLSAAIRLAVMIASEGESDEPNQT